MRKAAAGTRVPKSHTVMLRLPREVWTEVCRRAKRELEPPSTYLRKTIIRALREKEE